MSDSSKPRSIPAWQRQSGSSSADQSPSQSPSSPSSDDAPAPTSRKDLLNQATRFLEDESIRDSPTDRKVSFLESKGLTADEIQQVLGISRNLEATSTTPSTTEDKNEETPETSDSSSSPTESEAPPSTAIAQSQASSPSSVAMPQPRSSTATTTSPTAKREEPPIITYPEFLFQPSKPPPLVTMQSILYTLYGAAGLGAGIYSASEYLVKPMLANLTSARHEFSETAQTNLQQLNEKLEKIVTVIPPHLTARKEKSAEEDTEEDSDSVTSDPTELFHRDVGTQTTPDVSSSSTSLEPTKDENAPDAPSVAVSNHMSRLKAIQAQLDEVNDVEAVSSSCDESLRSNISELHHYLDGLMYSTPSYTVGGSGLYGGASSGSSGKSTGVRKSEDDAITSFKADIRGVKGALLSARNFPASRRGIRGGLTAGAR